MLKSPTWLSSAQKRKTFLITATHSDSSLRIPSTNQGVNMIYHAVLGISSLPSPSSAGNDSLSPSFHVPAEATDSPKCDTRRCSDSIGETTGAREQIHSKLNTSPVTEMCEKCKIVW